MVCIIHDIPVGIDHFDFGFAHTGSVDGHHIFNEDVVNIWGCSKKTLIRAAKEAYKAAGNLQPAAARSNCRKILSPTVADTTGLPLRSRMLICTIGDGTL